MLVGALPTCQMVLEIVFSAIIDFGIVPNLSSFFSHESKDVQSPALRVIGNLVTGNDVQTQAVLRLQCTAITQSSSSIHPVLRYNERRAVLFQILLLETSAQVQLLIDADLFASIFSSSHGECGYRPRRKLVVAVSKCNWTSTFPSRPGTISRLSGQYHKALCDFLQYNEPRMIVVALDAIL